MQTMFIFVWLNSDNTDPRDLNNFKPKSFPVLMTVLWRDLLLELFVHDAVKNHTAVIFVKRSWFSL